MVQKEKSKYQRKSTGILDEYLFKHSGGILADLHEPHDHIIQVDVTQGGVVFALPPHLVQEQVPAVHRRQQVLVLSTK